MKNIHLFVAILMAVLSAITSTGCLYFLYVGELLGFYIGLSEFFFFTLFGILAINKYNFLK